MAYYNGEYVNLSAEILPITIDEELSETSENPVQNKVVSEAINKLEDKSNNSANAIKGSAEGTVVAFDDVSPVEHNVAVKVKSENMIPYPFKDTTKTTAGITFTDTGDGGVEIKGTATSNSTFHLTTENPFESGKQYTISLNADPTTAALLAVHFRNASGVDNWKVTSTKTSFEWKDGYTFMELYLQVNPNSTVDTKVYPTLNEGTEAIPYKPFVDLTTVKVRVYNSNILTSEITSTSHLSDVASVENGIWTINNTYSENAYPSTAWQTLPAGTYTFKVDHVATVAGRIEYYFLTAVDDYSHGLVSTSEQFSDSLTITLEGPTRCRVVISVASGTNVKSRIQVNAGDVDIPFEPSAEAAEYTPNADGTVEGVTSISPNMTLLTDTYGTIIEAEYNRDTRKIIDYIDEKTKETKSYVDNEVAKPHSLTELKFSDFDVNVNGVHIFNNSCDVTIDGNIITVTPNNTYASVGIKGDYKVGQPYLVVYKCGSSYSGDRISFMHSSGAGWLNVFTKTVTVDNIIYRWGIITPTAEYSLKNIYIQTFDNSIITNDTLEIFTVEPVYNPDSIDDDYIKIALSGGVVYNISAELKQLNDSVNTLDENIKELKNFGKWYGKNVLFIGDSLTAAKQYQNTVAEILGINIHNHCKGGLGLLKLVDGDNGLGGDYDNETDASGILRPLSADIVSDMDLIVFYGGYNDRGKSDGTVGDCYATDGTGQSSIAGYMQYCINRIYEALTEAGNLTCKILIVTVDCAGRYSWIDADGYDEFPVGSGRNMETLANIQKAVSDANSVHCLDLWHNSGINRNTWSVFGASVNAVNDKYSPYELDSEGNPISETRIKYVTGNSYYQIRDGAVILEEYTGSSPYPYNGDQLHKSAAGYRRIGECIAGAIINAYGI